MLLMVEKGTRGEICHTIYQYAKANKKCVNGYDKNKESLQVRYWDINNLYGSAMSQKLLVNNFKQIKYTSLIFMKISYKVIMKKVMKYILFKFMFNILKN